MQSSPDDPTLYVAPEDGELPPATQAVPLIPGYRLQELLGRGSFGEVWKGIQLSSSQTVAVKLLTQAEGLDWSYFRLEVRSLARVAQHPNVVNLLDANLDHTPAFFVMAWLPNNLTEGCGTSVPQAEAWMDELAQALRHMHARGLIHCDLKPSNIMVDAEEHVRLTDFGQSLQRGSAAHRLGSLGYMAPEQADIEGLPNVGWDIYGLGACAYFLLTGSRPRLDDAAMAELRELPLDEGRLDRYREMLAERPPLPFPATVDRDLADLVTACLDVDAKRRPASADEVLQDLNRRRLGLPLLCRRPWSSSYRVGRFLKRQALGVTVAALFVAALAGSMGLLFDSRQEAVREAATRQFEKGWSLCEDGETAQALLWWTSAASLLPSEEAFRFPLNECPCRLENVLEMSGRVSTLAFTPDGKGLLGGTEDGEFALWDWSSGRLRLSHKASAEPHPLPLAAPRAVALSPSGDRILARGELWNVEDGSHQALGPWNQAEFSSDGRQALLLGQDQARLWPSAVTVPFPGLQTGQLAPDGHSFVLASARELGCWDQNGLHRTPLTPGVRGIANLAIRPDGRALAVVSPNCDGQLFSLPDLLPIRALPYSPALATAYSGDGKHQAVGCLDGAVNLLTEGEPHGVVNHLAMGPRSVRLTSGLGLLFSPDGQQLLGWSGDGSARLFDAYTGQPRSPTLRHRDTVWCAAFSADGKHLATGTVGGTVEVWGLAQDNPTPHTAMARLGSMAAPDSVIFIPGRSRVFTVGHNVCQLWDSHIGAPVGPPLAAPVSVFNFSQDGSALATSGSQGAFVWNSADGQRRQGPLGSPDARSVPVLDDAGQRVALVIPGESAQVFEVASGRQVADIPFGDYRSLVFHPNDAAAALVGPQGVALWDFAQRKVVRFYAQPLGLTVGRYLKNGDLLLLSLDGTTRLLHPDGTQESSALALDGPPRSNPNADPSGRWIALPIGDNAIRLLDRRSGQRLLPDLPDQLTGAFESDGHLLTASPDGVLSRWNIQPDTELPTPDLVRRAQRWTGLRLEPSGVVEPLSPQEWRRLK